MLYLKDLLGLATFVVLALVLTFMNNVVIISR